MQICLCLCVGDIGKIETAAALQFVVVLGMERRRPFINDMAVMYIYFDSISWLAGVLGRLLIRVRDLSGVKFNKNITLSSLFPL